MVKIYILQDLLNYTQIYFEPLVFTNEHVYLKTMWLVGTYY